MCVEERLLLNGIALRTGGVSPGNVEFAAAIEADFANSSLTFGDWATVSAGKAADTIVPEILNQG
jgi:hypothetical protein